jgi:hypothetical protein
LLIKYGKFIFQFQNGNNVCVNQVNIVGNLWLYIQYYCQVSVRLFTCSISDYWSFRALH